eukprot:1159399-Pelagomonas_calceolata.AAC.9
MLCAKACKPLGLKHKCPAISPSLHGSFSQRQVSSTEHAHKGNRTPWGLGLQTQDPRAGMQGPRGSDVAVKDQGYKGNDAGPKGSDPTSGGFEVADAGPKGSEREGSAGAGTEAGVLPALALCSCTSGAWHW